MVALGRVCVRVRVTVNVTVNGTLAVTISVRRVKQVKRRRNSTDLGK